jgi:hypothetical protein
MRNPAIGATFGTLVQVDDDQAFLLDGMEGMTGGRAVTLVSAEAMLRHPTLECRRMLKNLNIPPQCKGNGVDWKSGNTVRISDSVIQG